MVAADQAREVKGLAGRVEGNRAHAGILAHRLRRNVLVPGTDDIGPNLIRDHHAIVLAIDVHGALDLVALPHATAGIVRRTEDGGMDAVLRELALHVLKVHAPHALFVELKWAVNNTVARGLDGLGKADIGRTMDQHRVTGLHIGAQRRYNAAQHTVFIANMLRRQALNAVTTALPLDNAIEVLGAWIKVAKHRVLSTLNDVLLDRGHRGKVHIRHPHRDAVEALIGHVWRHTGDLAPGVNGDGIHAVAVDKRGKVVFHAALPCKADWFGRRYCPPERAALIRVLGLNLIGARAPWWLALSLADVYHGKLRPVDRKRYIEPSIGQVVDAVWLVFAASPARILAKDLD